MRKILTFREHNLKKLCYLSDKAQIIQRVWANSLINQILSGQPRAEVRAAASATAPNYVNEDLCEHQLFILNGECVFCLILFAFSPHQRITHALLRNSIPETMRDGL